MIRDWTKSIGTRKEGGYLIGNPSANLRLVEYASLTCPHLRRFHLEGMEELQRDFIASGAVAYEFRNFVLNRADLAAAMLARCDGAAAFLARVDALYRHQERWTEEVGTTDGMRRERIEAQPPNRQLVDHARAGALEDFARTLGISGKRFAQCLTDSGQAARLASMRERAMREHGVTGTPSFVLNGKAMDGTYSWTEVKWELNEALSQRRGQ